MYLDLRSFFFLIVSPELLVNLTRELVGFFSKLLERTSNIRIMSPLILNLYLNPLYSILGGSTIRADPFTKKPIEVCVRWKPLYNWNIFIHLTLVLSVTNSQDSLNNTSTVKRANRNCTYGSSVMSRLQDYLKARYKNFIYNSKI
jgi:hypothetical protein